MYKLVAIDLDGTMLNSYGIVTEHTKNIIQNTINKGIDVVIASGRPIDSIQSIAKEIGSNNYFIAGNGALIYDIKENKVVYEKYLSKQKVLEIIKLCEENSISYNVYTDKTILATSLKYNVLYYHKENLKKEESKKTQRTYLSFSVFLKCSFATFSNASKPYCFTNCFAHASTLLPAPFAKCIFHFVSISSIFFKNAKRAITDAHPTAIYLSSAFVSK